MARLCRGLRHMGRGIERLLFGIAVLVYAPLWIQALMLAWVVIHCLHEPPNDPFLIEAEREVDALNLNA